jgi:hypothetical protein
MSDGREEREELEKRREREKSEGKPGDVHPVPAARATPQGRLGSLRRSGRDVAKWTPDSSGMSFSVNLTSEQLKHPPPHRMEVA